MLISLGFLLTRLDSQANTSTISKQSLSTKPNCRYFQSAYKKFSILSQMVAVSVSGWKLSGSERIMNTP